jgi:hypothetical protein
VSASRPHLACALVLLGACARRPVEDVRLDLAAATASSQDLSAERDLAGADLAGADPAVADLAGADGAIGKGQDLGGSGPASGDLAVPARRVFLLPARDGLLGTLAALDQACETAAQNRPWTSSSATYRAVIGYPSEQDPKVRIVLEGGARPIVLPSGVQVATDATFFQASHAAAIDEDASGARPLGTCAWTSMSEAGSRIPQAAGVCEGWTTNDGAKEGLAGKLASSGWAVDALKKCDALCHVYCIGQ